MSLQANLIVVEHNVETGEVRELPITEQELKLEISPEIIAMREANEKKEAARKAVFEKLGLTSDEIDVLLG